MLHKNYFKYLALVAGFALIGLFSNFSISFTQGDTWTSKAQMSPYGRFGSAACALNGKIYVMGGIRANSWQGVKNVDIFDPLTNSWTTSKQLPIQLEESIACAVNGKIYLMGGRTHADEINQHLNRVYEFDPVTQNWTQKASMPTAKSDFCAFAVDGKIYTIAGRSNYEYYPRDVEVYDPATDTWSKKGTMPETNNVFGAALVNGKIYVIGGVLTDNNLYVTASVEEYVPPTPAPYITYQSYNVDDSQGNNNGNPDSGESVKIIITLRNFRLDAVNVSATLRSPDPDVQISHANSNFGDIPRNQTNTNQNNPFIFSVASSCTVHFCQFYLDISGDGG